MTKLLALVALVLALWLLPHAQAQATANAPSVGTCTSYVCSSQQAAYSAAYNEVNNGSEPCPVYGYNGVTHVSTVTPLDDSTTDGKNPDHYQGKITCNGNAIFQSSHYGWGSAQCETSGQTWSETTHTCALTCPGAQADPDNPGTCMTDAKCQARNADLGLGSSNVVRTWTSICQAGCTYQIQNAEKVQNSGGTFYRGSMYVSGTCATNDATDAMAPNNTSPKTHPIPEPPQCVPAGSGQTFCIQPDGRQCATASTGRQICWTPNEVGEKTDQNVLQKRCNGSVCPDKPDAPPPPNDTFTKGTTTSTTTTPPGSTTGNTTTITNYTTGTGGPAGSGNTGCSSSTQSGCAPNGTASGGGSCDAPPIVSDPALSMVATQAWATRCAVVAGNTVKVTGDIGNCGAAFTIEGADTDANVQKLRAMRAQICGTGKNPDGHDSTAAVNGSDDGTALLGTMGGEHAYGAEGIDDAGYGLSRTCPRVEPVTIYGQTIDLNSTKFCDWIKTGGQFVLLLATLMALRVLGGGTRLD